MEGRKSREERGDGAAATKKLRGARVVSRMVAAPSGVVSSGSGRGGCGLGNGGHGPGRRRRRAVEEVVPWRRREEDAVEEGYGGAAAFYGSELTRSRGGEEKTG